MSLSGVCSQEFAMEVTMVPGFGSTDLATFSSEAWVMLHAKGVLLPSWDCAAGNVHCCHGTLNFLWFSTVSPLPLAPDYF
jgi:hypothetical protein